MSCYTSAFTPDCRQHALYSNKRRSQRLCTPCGIWWLVPQRLRCNPLDQRVGSSDLAFGQKALVASDLVTSVIEIEPGPQITTDGIALS